MQNTRFNGAHIATRSRISLGAMPKTAESIHYNQFTFVNFRHGVPNDIQENYQFYAHISSCGINRESYIIFRMYRVQISARRQAIMSEFVHIFPYFLQVNAGIIPEI
jgi:hypothetical protein